MRNAYFGMSAALRTGDCYIVPVQPRSWAATLMVIGLATPPIADPRPDTRSPSGVPRSHGAVRNSRQLHCQAPKLSTEERLSRPAKPYGCSGYLRTYKRRCLIRRRSTATTSATSSLRKTLSSTHGPSTLRCTIISSVIVSFLVKSNFSTFRGSTDCRHLHQAPWSGQVAAILGRARVASPRRA